MRQIKFRCQATNNNGHAVFLCFSLGDLVCGTAQHYQDTYGYEYSDWCQFTGLKDCKGVEIYESDIVNYHFVEDHLSCTVMWNEDRCCFGFKDKGEDVIYGVNVGDVAERAEVIGNIYQHKELLE